MAKTEKKEAGQEAQKELSLEEAFEKIEHTIGRLEEEEITLEESFRTYQEGMKLLQYCNEKIDKVEKQVLMINEDGELYEF
ncbi:MAG: exodeoxyribonuclease VII small subunit [Blautia sp.]|nr:exodeoxyribonuclease VII small subunit [Muribaculaceae bacterium]MCM1143769.1 exodeoxyribonuclease VII small subunit [Lachnoclostridium sp.]MCM1210692.1 exodeoxyribonuclease VII small subunit [Blautia sp.]